MSAGILIQLLENVISEKVLLVYSDAPIEELHNAQRSVDKLQEEVLRRMSW